MTVLERAASIGALDQKPSRLLVRHRERALAELARINLLTEISAERVTSARTVTMEAGRAQWLLATALEYQLEHRPQGAHRYTRTTALGADIIDDMLIQHGRELKR